MSKLAHSREPTMGAIDYRRAMRDGTLRPMSEAPTNGTVVDAVMADDLAPNCEKIRFVRVKFDMAACFYAGERAWIDIDSDGKSIDEDELEGWIDP